MWSRFRLLPWHCQGYIGLVVVLSGIFAATWLSVLNAQAAPCPPIGCVPLPTLPGPTGLATPPGAFITPPPNPRPTASPTASPIPVPTQAPPGTQAPVPGQDVGVTALAQAAAGSASALSRQLNSQVQAPTMSGDWFRPLYSKMTTIAIYVLLLCLLLAVLQYIVHRRFGMVAASWFGWAPGSIAITALAITVTNLLLAITDGFCAYMLQGLDIAGFLEHLAVVFALVAAGAALTGTWVFLAGFLAILILAALVGILAELLMRQVVIYVCLLWLPLVAATSVWNPARQWLYRLATLQLTVILAKFAVVVMLALGVAAFAANPAAMGSLGDPNLTAVVMGLVILVVALISPFLLLRLLPHNFEHAAAGVSNMARRRVTKLARRGGKSLSKRYAARQAGKAGVPIATKAAAAAGAVVPISLVISKAGQIVAARGGNVIRQPKPQPQAQSKGQDPAGHVRPTARPSPVSPRRPLPPGPAGRRGRGGGGGLPSPPSPRKT